MKAIKNSGNLIPYGRQNITNKDINAVIDVLNSPTLTQGGKVPEFERKICSSVDSSYAVAVNSATSALHIACKSLGLSSGDYVWTSPITFVASANCALYCGGLVDFVDIDYETGLISISKLEEKLKIAASKNILPKILIPVHLGGASCDMERIHELSKTYNFKVIEDASHAIGGGYKSFQVGSCKFSDITVFSFHPVKIITTGEGGIATTNSKTIADRMSILRSHGITKDESKFIYKTRKPWKYEQQDLGFNYRITDIQAALGISQLTRLKQIVSARNKIAKLYEYLFTGSRVSLIKPDNNVYSAYHLASARLHECTEEEHLHTFEYLRENGIGTQIHYTPVHLQPYYKNLGFKEGDFPNAERYSISTLSLPMYPELSKDQIMFIVNTLNQVFK